MRCHVPITINGRPMKALVDTGAETTVIGEAMCRKNKIEFKEVQGRLLLCPSW